MRRDELRSSAMRSRLVSALLVAAAVAFPPALVASTDADPEAEARLEATLGERIDAWDWRGALAAADEEIARRPDSLVAWRYRAYALHQLGRVSPAVAAYQRTLALDPENGWAFMNLAELLTRERRWNEAIAAATRAVEIEPRSVEAQAKLSLAHRERGAYEDAAAAVERALLRGTDPAWCHAELGYLRFALEDAKASRAHWTRASELGFDADACAHGLKLADWEEKPPTPSLSAREREERSRRRRGDADEWTFEIGRIQVRTRVGPALPRDVTQTIERIQKEYAAFLGLSGAWSESIRLHVSRTVEEHEEIRQRAFPQGYRGKAFLERRPMRPMGGGPPFPRGERGRGARRGEDDDDDRDGGERWRLDIHVAFSEADFEPSLSHELAHAILQVRVARASDIPAWFDEGIATHLELHPDASGKPVSGALRPDLLAALREARASGVALGFEEMIFADRRRFEGRDARARYAEAWAIVHYLLAVRSNGRTRLGEYLDALELDRSRDRERAFTAAWGSDWDAIERDYSAWLEKVAPPR